MNDLFNVRGKNVLVSGGGRGIGQMIATGFVRNGANVYISSRDEQAINRTADELTKLGPGKCYGIAIDLAKHNSADELINTLKTKFNVTQLHVLINNSGNSWGEPLEQFSEKGWDRVMELNVKALFFLTKSALPLLQAAASNDSPARVINIGSVAGVRPQSVPTWSYDTSKAAVHHLTTKFAGELASKSITVNAIAPGFVPSKMSKQLLTYNTEDEMRNAIPLKRFAKTGDMAGPALFFASPAAAWITGTVLVVDGGQMASPPRMIEKSSKL